ncbi:hypothetical protein [Vibrio gallaecicus]|nr:hypothetical protein [Vibrio gallaecicus]MDN3617067.1 hypothetical protein [Vibrio gallaecicus]
MKIGVDPSFAGDYIQKSVLVNLEVEKFDLAHCLIQLFIRVS